MSQTAYQLYLSKAGFEGQLADSGQTDKWSVIGEGAIPFGKLVVRGTDVDKQGNLPSAAGDITPSLNVWGMAIHSQSVMSDPSVVPAQYPDKSAVPCLRKGRAYVKVEEAVTVASAVHVRYAAGGNGLGSFGDTTGTSERAPLAGAKYMSDAAANEFAIIEFNL